MVGWLIFQRVCCVTYFCWISFAASAGLYRRISVPLSVRLYICLSFCLVFTCWSVSLCSLQTCPWEYTCATAVNLDMNLPVTVDVPNIYFYWLSSQCPNLIWICNAGKINWLYLIETRHPSFQYVCIFTLYCTPSILINQ